MATLHNSTTNDRPLTPLTPNKTQNFNRDDIFRKLKRFSKYLEKNINNHIPYDIEQNVPTRGFYLKIGSISGIKKDRDLRIIKDKKFYLKFYITFFEEFPKKFFGNTYKSNDIPIQLLNDQYYDLSTPEYVYFLSNLDSKSGLHAIIEVVFVEEDTVKGTFEYESEGWGMLRLSYNFQNELNNCKSFIYKGTPRNLLFKNQKNLLVRDGAAIIYDLNFYKEFEVLKNLIPKFCFFGKGDSIPGLDEINLSAQPKINNPMKLIPDFDVYIKNVEINFPEEMEMKMLLVANQYRKQKYDIENDSQLRPVSIQNRKFRCGINNSWVFVNKNGLENTINLTRIDKDLLGFKGVIHVDNYFCDSMLGFIFELSFVIILPLPYNREELLNLTSCYCICIPEVVDNENRFFSYVMITGPGYTIYGEKLFDTEAAEKERVLIKLNFILSKNKEYTDQSSNQKEMLEMRRKYEAMRINDETQSKTIIKEKEQFLIKREEELLKDYEMKKLELEKQYLSKTVASKELQIEKPKEIILSNTQVKKEVISERNPMEIVPNDSSRFDPRKTTFREEAQILDKKISNSEIKNINTLKETTDLKEKKDLEKSLSESRYLNVNNQIEDNKPIEKFEATGSKVVYDQGNRDISQKDKAELLSRGFNILQNMEYSNNLSSYHFETALNDENKAFYFSFLFLSYKPKLNINDYSQTPDRIYMKFGFWNYGEIVSDVALVNKPRDTNIQYSTIPLMLTKEVAPLISNSDEKEIKIEIQYDPTSDPFTDFKDFIEYLIYKNIYVEIYDAEKNFLIGFIKVNLRDFLSDKKLLAPKTREYDIFNENLEVQGCLQMIIKINSQKTLRPFDYDIRTLRIVDTREKNLNVGKKKKVTVKPMNVNNFNQTDKEYLGKTLMNSDKLDQKILSQTKVDDPTIRLNIDNETQKRLRAMKYARNPENIKINPTKIEEMKKKQEHVGEFYKNLNTIQKIREFKKEEILSKTVNENTRNSLTLSLVVGKPHIFSLLVNNPYDHEQLFQIIIGEKSMNDEKSNHLIRVVADSEEWSYYCEQFSYIKPKDYNIISSKNVFLIQSGETIPIMFKLLTYDISLSNSNHIIWVYRNNGYPQFSLNLNINEVFPLTDHIFRYYLPENKYENVLIPNPFKFDKNKTNNLITNYHCTDKSVSISLEPKTNNFLIKYKVPLEGNFNDFDIFFYNDKYFSQIELNWKIFIYGVLNIDLQVKIGSKLIYKLPVEDKISRTVKLFSSNPEIAFIPQQNESEVVLIPNVQNIMKICVYPKKDENNEILLNLVDISNRELIKTWIMRVKPDVPKYENVQNIECKLNKTTNIKFEYKNTLNSWIIYNFESNSKYLHVIDTRVSFNAFEKKIINLSVSPQTQMGRAEVCLFISDVDELFSEPILFKLNFC